jgi:hypothetical protein
MAIILQIKLVCMLIILHFTKLHLIKCNVSRVVSIKQNVNCEVSRSHSVEYGHVNRLGCCMIFNFEPPAMFLFLFFAKVASLKVIDSFDNISDYRISQCNVDRCKIFIHLRRSNVRHFVMVDFMVLKIWRRGHLQCHGLPTEFRKNVQVGSSVGRGSNTQTGR